MSDQDSQSNQKNPAHLYVDEADKRFREESVKTVVVAVVAAVVAPIVTGFGLFIAIGVLVLGGIYQLILSKLRSDQRRHNIIGIGVRDKSDRPRVSELQHKFDLTDREDLTPVQKLAIYAYQTLDIESSSLSYSY